MILCPSLYSLSIYFQSMIRCVNLLLYPYLLLYARCLLFLLLLGWSCATAHIPCLNPPAPVSNAILTMSWDIFGTIATYTCPPGWHFAEGGTRRTLVCTDGTWPQKAPVCTGIEALDFD